MGVEVSKLGSAVVGSRGGPAGTYPSSSSPGVDYPNLCRNELEASAWTLLHQCTLDKWKDGHADAAGFMESRLTCDGVVHKDCSRSFCMSRQGIINISRSSFFSFRKRSKFAHMAEHFEYNHIPAQMSSINHFRVCGVLCFDESLVVLHLSCNVTCQFGLLDLRANKFLGVFGKQSADVPNDSISGELSPDKSKCLIAMPLVGDTDNTVPPVQRRVILRLYDLRTAALLSETTLDGEKCHFAFDPRFSWRRAVVTNFERGSVNSLNIVDTENWRSLSTNRHATDETRGGRGRAAASTLYPFLKDLQYTRGGSLIVATLLDNVCYCREKRTMSAGPGGAGNYRPVAASVYVYDGETADTLHCIQYRRYTCAIHSCPVNYRPLWSACGSRMAVVMDTNSSTQHYVQVYKLPASPTVGLSSLQALCRVAILQSECRHYVDNLPLPSRIIKYLQFRPEYEA